MAILHPFRAVRPLPERASEVASVPYDVISTEEARNLARGNPASFLHVIRPEIDLESGIDEHEDRVYRKGAENLMRFIQSADTVQEETPSLYLYRQIMEGRSQAGIFGCVAVSDYDADVILKHELTRPVKEDDRTRHILEQQAHAEPVMLTFRDDAGIQALMDGCAASKPLYDFVASDGVQHTIWRFGDAEPLVSAFDGVDRLYVADGHHRCKAASRAWHALGSNAPEEAGYFPAVLFPMAQMRIMAYNRIVRRLPDSSEVFLACLSEMGALRSGADPAPSRRGDVSFYLDGAWFGFTLPEASGTSPADRLDVGRLTEHVLEPLLGISDPRRDPNIDFVGGIRGTAALKDLVDSGAAQLAISMFPTSIQELMDVSDAGLLMPPKSTWFEPKLRSGLLVHLFSS